MKSLIRIVLLITLMALCGQAHAYDVIRTENILTIRGTKKYKMNQPSDVAVNPQGDIYIMDGINGRILGFDYDGDIRFSLSHIGRDYGSFNSALGLNIDSDGNVLIADTGAHRIVVFDRNGRFTRIYNLPSGETAADPTDVFSDLEYHYIADNDNHRILIYKADGTFFDTFGKEGEGPGEFRYPYKIEMDEERRLYVVDVLNSRIQILTTSGQYLGQIGGFGVTPGSLFRPNGIAFDRKGRILVSDSYFGVIQAFDRSGNFLGVIGDKEGRTLRFKSPSGLWVDKENRLFIVDMPAGTVSIRKLLD